MQLLKTLWGGDWTVKISLIFVMLIGVMVVYAHPGPTILLILFGMAGARLINHMEDQ